MLMKRRQHRTRHMLFITGEYGTGAVSKLGVQRIQWRDVGAAVGAGPLDGPCGEIKLFEQLWANTHCFFVRIRP